MTSKNDRLLGGIALTIIGFLGLSSGGGMMGGYGMMGYGMMGGLGYGPMFISYLLSLVFLATMLLGIYIVFKAVM